LGVFSASREIIKELPIYHRERLVNLNIVAYVFSKLLVLLGLSIVQSVVLVLMVHWWSSFVEHGVLGIPKIGILPGIVEILITIILLTFASACFGLFLSAIIGREDRIMSVMPAFLMLQIVFAGVVFSVTSQDDITNYDQKIFSCTSEEHQITALISCITFSRWGIEAMGSTVNMPALGKAVKTSSPPVLPLAFQYNQKYLFAKWQVMIGYTILFILLTILALKRQDVN